MPKYKYVRANDSAPWEITVLNKRVKNNEIITTDGYLPKSYIDSFKDLVLQSHVPYTNTILFSTTGPRIELDNNDIVFDMFAQVSSGSMTITINEEASKKITIYESGLVGRNFTTVAVRSIEISGNGCIYGVVNNTFTPMNVMVVE